MHRPLSGCVPALAANGMMISALAGGGDGAIPWLLAARADKIAPLSLPAGQVRWLVQVEYLAGRREGDRPGERFLRPGQARRGVASR